MNTLLFSNPFERLQHKLILYTRLLAANTTASTFSATEDGHVIQRIYVINLDRKPDRWIKIKQELERIRDRSGNPLSSITRRFSAIDARYLGAEIEDKALRPYYTLADQLLVEPNPLVPVDVKSRSRRIEMTPQEVAVALSHIEVWKLIAESNVAYTLVLEDDVYFQREFASNLDAAWRSIKQQNSEGAMFDLLYLSFKEVGVNSLNREQSLKLVHKPDCGIWQASGYVLSKVGAQKLLNLLPAYGPIDLWLNLKFNDLDVLLLQNPIIEQRIDVPSTNSYSIMPVLSQIGVHIREKPLVPPVRRLLSPIFAYGDPGSGLTALAKALSMLGYTCCSDITQLPDQEKNNLLTNSRRRNFNAYVNIGSLDHRLHTEITKAHPNARFIFTTLDTSGVPFTIRDRALYLPIEHRDKWEILRMFLECEYPALTYPSCDDIGQQDITTIDSESIKPWRFKHLKFDPSPWILSSKKWRGISLTNPVQGGDLNVRVVTEWNIGNKTINTDHWKFRDDTFPSNLALFTPENIEINDSGVISLMLSEHNVSVRRFTSGAIASRKNYLYGRFSAEIKPSNVSGLITGLFLHRNSPYQEIDIEFIGKDTTQMLINVFYNPGIEGTKLEYGYRGTPTLIELDFDASEEFHEYEIEWEYHSIRWRIDGHVVHERVLWNPTPIPDLPMELNVNLWPSRSRKLAGNLDISKIPAQAEIRSIRITQRNE